MRSGAKTLISSPSVVAGLSQPAAGTSEEFGVNIPVFVTDDGTEAGTGPILFLKDMATATMPAHPRGLEWKYFATVGQGDELLGEDRNDVRLALEADEPFIAHRLLRRLHE